MIQRPSFLTLLIALLVVALPIVGTGSTTLAAYTAQTQSITLAEEHEHLSGEERRGSRIQRKARRLNRALDWFAFRSNERQQAELSAEVILWRRQLLVPLRAEDFLPHAFTRRGPPSNPSSRLA